ncbi:uncharacterized protein LOC121376517 [Gigantopelta aegis]|uniref:uncharacterized protein LOC121376517 n=1 Tax=Gigantopelta aegis TaxID=1735272 RepID=UPI001B88E1BC|nr:uncharacterized protein LOC121376517 [Gigantopelta aegis]
MESKLCALVFLFLGVSFVMSTSQSERATFNPCKIGSPVLNDIGMRLFCGRGLHRVTCPAGSHCLIDPADRFAVCCPTFFFDLGGLNLN